MRCFLHHRMPSCERYTLICMGLPPGALNWPHSNKAPLVAYPCISVYIAHKMATDGVFSIPSDAGLWAIYIDLHRSATRGAELKSTSRHIFEKVLICIERGIFCTDIKEMNMFENFIFGKRCSFFTSQLSCSDPLASLEEKGNTFCNNHICILYRKK